jgi:drug/metabolite transporter (DMT)-like permease
MSRAPRHGVPKINTAVPTERHVLEAIAAILTKSIPMRDYRKSLLEIHSAVLLFGGAGLFAKILPLPAPVIVLGRVFFAAVSLLVIILLSSDINHRVRSARDFLVLMLLGAVLAIHWITFFRAIQVSTVAIGLISYSTFPIFAAVLEPAVFGRRARVSDFVLALLAFFGVMLIVPRFEMHDNLTRGVLWGLASAATFAVLSVLNRYYVRRYSSLTIALHQNAFAAVLLLPAAFLLQFTMRPSDLLLLIVLGVVFTAIAHTLFIKGMRYVSAHAASVIACLEMVYGVIFAVLLLGEIPTARTIIGGTLVLLAALYATRTSRAGHVEWTPV